MLIIITGTPGTGKSTLAKLLAQKLGYQRIGLHHYYKQLALQYNRKKHCYDLDYHKFLRLVKTKLKVTPHLIIDSHVAHLLPKRMVDLCIVLTCSDLKVLERRLKRRKYSQRKIRENLEAEIFQVCLMEAQERGHKAVVVDSCWKSSAAFSFLGKFLDKAHQQNRC